MGDKSAIEWTDATWNVVTGCTRISDDCQVCYIERTPPFRMEGRRFDGPHIGATTGVRLHPERLDQPLRWQRPRRIFVNSLADLFHDEVPDAYIAEVFAVMALSPRHTFQVLTKRPARMRALMSSDTFSGQVARLTVAMAEAEPGPPYLPEHLVVTHGRPWWPLQNVWLGVSAENQRWADLRIPVLLDTPAAVRWISAEPLLGPIDLRYLAGVDALLPDWMGGPGGGTGAPHPLLDWVVAGGESGPGARPMHPDWARSLRDQCQDAEVPFLLKQWGGWEPIGPLYGDDDETADAHMEAVVIEVHENRRVIQLERSGYIAEGHQPTDDRTWLMARVGKKRAGRLLDGRVWDEYPREAH
ncbi:DUF5131 family protein [Sphaerimonospora thailandensis]|uniref:Protein gp37 n=1 Tax=Sphaerimonospora thailandensis TaxID=795644 RepID=A0A8J3RAD5_9ACTN|nr:phage Gp37/Gp68 family protein [Sphaerimonospora thailandensis]GIH70299.1 hypothetical protein Mth01_25520 [Sphaerimonospora thailandensis]